MSAEGTTHYIKATDYSLELSTDSLEEQSLWSPPVDLDGFLVRVYEYYQGKGFGCSILSKFFNLLSFTWVALFLLFIFAFFDFSDFSMSFEASFPSSPLFYLCAIVFFIAWLALGIYYISEIRSLLEMRWFYTNKLSIYEEEMPTISWSTVVDRLIMVPGLSRRSELTHLSIAQRILRKENYIIALINRDILALHFPLAYFAKSRTITKSLEWSLSLSLFKVLFSKASLKYSYNEVQNDPRLREKLAKEVRKSFIFVGILSLILSPLIFILLFTYFVLKYGEELRNKPNNLSIRVWSRYAHWKFREFNELPHELEDRLNMAVSPATSYVDQFTSHKLVLACRYILFVCGSIVIYIIVTSFFAPDLLEEDIFLDRNGIWWLAVCGSIIAICRGFIPDDDFVFVPEHYFDQVSTQTHYLPPHWQENCRSPTVLNEFNSLFQYRLYALLLESLSVLFVPFIFLFSMPQCSMDAVMFIYENTITTEDVGDICTFANFDFEKHGNSLYGSIHSAPTHKQSKDGKMEQSFLNFCAKHPRYQPKQDGSDLINNLENFVEEHKEELPLEVTQLSTSHHVLGSSFLGGPPSPNISSPSNSILQIPLTGLSQLQQGYRENKERSFSLDGIPL